MSEPVAAAAPESTVLAPLFQRMDALRDFIDNGHAVLTPNRRLSRAVRSADSARRDDGAWISPAIAPLRQFWTDQWHEAVTAGHLAPQRLLDARQQRLLWEAVIDREPGEGFSLLSTTQAAQLCQQADERLLLWQVDPDAARWQSWFTTDHDGLFFLNWRRRFEGRLRALGASTPERAQAALLAALHKDPGRHEIALAPLVLLDCGELAPLYAALVACAPAATVLEQADGGDAEAHVAVEAFEDRDAQLLAAARWCHERAHAHPGGRYAVVLQDMQTDRARFETLLRREFDCLTQDYDRLPVNFATGFSLGPLPLVRDALRILSLGARETDLEDSLALLRSRFVSTPALPAGRAETVTRRLRGLGVERLPTQIVRDGLAGLFEARGGTAPWDTARILSARGERLGRKRHGSEWISVYRLLLAAWQWCEGVALDSLEYQQRQHWDAALDTFAGLDELLGKLTYEESLASLRRLLDEQPFQPQTTDRGIQVLGPLETTGLSFDGLWLTGMNAGRWPARARPNPYLPTALQRRLHMPGADASVEAEEAGRRWAHWRSCTPRLRASFVRREDDTEQLPSPLLGAWPARDGRAPETVDARWKEQLAAPDVPVDAGRSALRPDEAAHDGIGSGILEAQVQCPFQAFAAARLLAPAPDAPGVGLDPRERGSLLHRALHAFFLEHGDREALRRDAASTSQALDRAVAGSFALLRPERRQLLGAGLLALEQQRLLRLLEAWTHFESEREDHFTVTDCEVQRDLHLGPMRLRLRIDRLDRLADGTLLLIDYKTGRPESIEAWLREPPDKPQMPLYALAEPNAEGLAYALVRPDALEWRGIGAAPGLKDPDDAAVIARATGGIEAPASTDGGSGAPGPSWAALRSFWHDALSQVAQDFAAGEAAVAPLDGACRTCGRQALCRIDGQGR